MALCRWQTPLLLCLVVLSGALCSVRAELVLQQVDREIKLHSHLTVITDTYSVKNTGKQPVGEVVYCFPERHAEQLAFVEVTAGPDDDAPSLKVSPASVSGAPSNVTCYKATVDQALKGGASIEVVVYAVFTKLQTPFPATITQSDPQRVLYHDNIYVLSPYQIASQTTKVRLPSRKVESFTKQEPASLSGTVLTYGPYPDVAPFSQARMRLHFENNTPFAEVVSLEREIEVSHWGNVYVEERYTLLHAGAKHKGEWSRLDYMKEPSKYAVSSVRTLPAELPATAHTIYFRDEIGNVSTSHVRRMRDKVQVELNSRFPLVGGWRVEFIFGYSLPLSSVAERLPGGRVRLLTSFTTPIEGVFVDDLTVKVVLPEGATDIKTQVPFDLDNQSEEHKFSYLDTTGRPVVVLRKTNVVPDHNVPFETTYKFSRLAMLKEPMLLVTAFLLMFATAIVYNRCEFTLAHDDNWAAAQQGERGIDLLQRVATVFTERRRAMAHLDEFASSSDAAEFNRVRAATEQRLQTSADQLGRLGGDLERLAGKHANRVRDMLEKERQLATASLDLARRRSTAHVDQLSEEEQTARLAAPTQTVATLTRDVKGLADELQAAW